MKYTQYNETMRSNENRLKPQDILLALKLVSKNLEHTRMLDIALELGMSQSEISHGLERLKRSRLLGHKRDVQRHAFLEFLIFGLQYVYPAKMGHETRGIATAHSAKPLSAQIKSDQKYVWPDSDGDTRGQSISPLYESAPFAAKKDSKLYELLALVDSVRIGKAREQELARKELKKRVLDL